MNSSIKTARIAGVLFLTAMVTSLVGGIWLESITSVPDYLTTISENEAQVIIGVLLELVNCIAVIGIAVVLFPILSRLNKVLALGYVAIRVVEAVVLAVAVISPLLLVTLSKEYVSGGASDATYFQTLGTLLVAARARMAGLLVPIFFGLGAVLFYYLLYISRLVPRFISVWGLIAVALMLSWNLLATFGVSLSAALVFGLPIILNEIFLGFWLIVKGFDTSPIASGSTA